jgi:hypothetical protein
MTIIPTEPKRKTANRLARNGRCVFNMIVRGNAIKKRLLTISQTVDNQSIARESEKLGAMQPSNLCQRPFRDI